MLPLEGEGGAKQTGFRMIGGTDRDPLHALGMSALGAEAVDEQRSAQPAEQPVHQASGQHHRIGAVAERIVAGGRAERHQDPLQRMGSAKDVGLFAFWAVAAIMVTLVLVAITLAAASLVLMAIWHLGRWINPRR